MSKYEPSSMAWFCYRLLFYSLLLSLTFFFLFNNDGIDDVSDNILLIIQYGPKPKEKITEGL
jgi:hypothetical protein